MSTPTRRRTLTGVVTLTLALTAGPGYVALHAQETTQPDVLPGTYQKGPCAPAAFPEVLPALHEVLDSAALMPALASVGLDKSVVLSLRLGSMKANPPVRVIQAKGSPAVATKVADAIQQALRQIPPGDPWALRLLVDPGNPPALRLARSQLCPPASERPVTRTRTYTMGEGQASRMQQQMQEEARLRQMVRFRVLVQPNGKPADVVLTASSGDQRIDSELQQAIRRTHFFAATLDGARVAAWFLVGGP